MPFISSKRIEEYGNGAVFVWLANVDLPQFLPLFGLQCKLSMILWMIFYTYARSSILLSFGYIPALHTERLTDAVGW